MRRIDSYLRDDEQPTRQRHHQNSYSSASASTYSYSLTDTTEITLSDLLNPNTISSSMDSAARFQYSILLLNISLGFICACLCLLTIMGNLLVLITFRRLRKVGNLFILSLATADLIVGCFVMPIAGIYALMEKWNMGLLLCQIWLSVDFTASTASIFNLLTLSLDRYWSITSPLQYLGKRTRTRALFLIGLAWGLSILWVIPIFGWHRFVNNGTRYIDSTKCEPEYMHSKVFKVSTGIINFYLPLLMLISLNGRIYFEIKRRYKNALLQRYSNRPNDSPSACKSRIKKQESHLPIAMTLSDGEKQLCPAAFNLLDDGKRPASKRSSVNHEIVPSLRINYKEKRNRPVISSELSNPRRSSMQHAYASAKQTHCHQDELTWFAHHERSRPSLSPTPNLRPHRAGSKSRLNVDERCFKHSHNCPLCPMYHNVPLDPSFKHHRDSYSCYQAPRQPSLRGATSRTPPACRRCSLVDTMRVSTSTTATMTTTMNIFNLCHYCSAATSAISIRSNVDPYDGTRKASSSSVSSTHSRKQRAASFYSIRRNSIISAIVPRSNSYTGSRTPNKIKQATVWNQQEKAFRQLFAIVFGFTVCFLPYFILYMVVAFCGSCISEHVLTLTVWLGYVNSTINPFLYALSNKHFRRTFKQLLHRNQRRQSYYN